MRLKDGRGLPPSTFQKSAMLRTCSPCSTLVRTGLSLPASDPRSADGGSSRTHRQRSYVAETEATTQQHQHCNKRDDFLLHVFKCAQRGESQTNGNDDGSWPPRTPDQHSHQPRQRACRFQKGKCATHEQDGEDDVRARDDAARHSEQRGLQSHRSGCHARVRSRDDNLSSGCFVFSSLIFARRNDPRQQGSNGDRAEQKDKGMGKAEFHMSFGSFAFDGAEIYVQSFFSRSSSIR